MTLPNPSMTDLANLALDKAYAQIMGPLLKQIYAICNAPGSALQLALAELDAEADRLEQAGQPLLSTNAVLLKTMDTMEKTYELTAVLLKSVDNKVQASGAGVAIPAVTARIFSRLFNQRVAEGQDPLSPQALQFYTSTLKQAGVDWKIR